ncbi:MAG: type I-E CRISPR-associated endoribonuclease Cas2 [Atopobiaceae bacterium]|nr:type I-E CRISPR-associated endoribonuclease Cas2 [Atopobiaceae bacterium]
MVVIVLEKCPLALRGDLTKWLQEISLGVYVGQVSARVRENLWQRVCAECKSGRATMVYSARNEQHLSFEVHNATWEPIDFDGLKLMLRPNAQRMEKHSGTARVRSDASIRLKSQRQRRVTSKEPDEYVVLDLETTGLDSEHDAIIDIGAIRYLLGQEDEEFQTFVRVNESLPESVVELTGIRDNDIVQGMGLEDALNDLLDFIGNSPIVMHNASFDLGFLEKALEEFDLDELDNELIDTLEIARKRLPHVGNHRLDTLRDYFGLEETRAHRALGDCRSTRELLLELLKL